MQTVKASLDNVKMQTVPSIAQDTCFRIKKNSDIYVKLTLTQLFRELTDEKL